MHLLKERVPLIAVGAGLLALYWLSTRRVAAATVGGNATPTPQIVLPGAAPDTPGATPGTDSTDFSPAWTNSGDPSNTDIFDPAQLYSGAESISVGQPGSATGPLQLTP